MSDEERLNPIQWFLRGGWYFFVSLASLGILSPVPFLHAASRVRGLKAVLLLVEAVVFVAAVVTGLALPESQADLGVGLLLGAAGLGCVLQVPARPPGLSTQGEAPARPGGGQGARRPIPPSAGA